MAHPVYLPILRSRQGEFTAIRNLGEDVRGKVFPVVEVVPPPWDLDEDGRSTGVRKKSTATHCLDIACGIENSWGAAHPIAVDLHLLLTAEGIDDWTIHPVTQLFGELSARGTQAVPVVGGREDADTVAAVRAAVLKSGRGMVLRVVDRRLEPDEVAAALERILRLYGLSRDMVDLLIDWEKVTEHLEYRLAPVVRELVQGIPKIGSWRSFTFAGSAFPSNSASIVPDSVEEIHRTEWALWKLLAKDATYALERTPLFGDYTINGSNFDDLTVRPSPSANIRYTASESWFYYKGSSLTPRRVSATAHHSEAYAQFVDLANKIVANKAIYRGPRFSYGDSEIRRYARGQANQHGKVPTGHQSIWRGIGVNHHIKQVLDQLAS